LRGGSGTPELTYNKFEKLKNEAIEQEGKEDQTMKYIEYASETDLNNLVMGIETLVLFNPDNEDDTKFDNLPITLKNIYIMHSDDGQGSPQPLEKLFPKLPFGCKVERITGSYHLLNLEDIRDDWEETLGKKLPPDLNLHWWIQNFSKPPFNDELAKYAKNFGYTKIEEPDDDSIYLWINFESPETYYG
jgi:hypothetical protein